jgi:hypothetical protein
MARKVLHLLMLLKVDACRTVILKTEVKGTLEGL